MIRPLQLSQLASISDANWHGDDTVFSEVSTDTRTLQKGQLYFALKGPNFDGNAYAAQAMEKGACAVVVSSATAARPCLEVSDTTRALGALARWNREQSQATVVAITGSQGKTTVKEMIGAILRVRHQVLVTRGNLNNEVGVPLTLLQLGPADQYAVVELGASAAGEIAYTVSLARPQVVVLNNAGAAHLEGFGSLQGVVQAKGEIIDGVAPDGTVVLNADHASLPEWRARAAGCRVRTFSVRGKESGADCFAEDISLDAATGSRFRLVSEAGTVNISVPLPGMHNVANAAAAACAALAAGVTIGDVASGLAAVPPVAGRLRALPGLEGATVIDDSYNASPASFRAAIDVLSACSGKRILIVGDMAELGPDGNEAHAQVGHYARQMKIDELWAVGKASAAAAREFGAGHWFDSQSALVAHARGQLNEEVTVLVKGSRSSRMDEVVAQLSAGDTH